jgi:F-type H+-transporting ATPase subunit delta
VAESGSRARRYAEALLEIATEERAVPAYRQSLERLARSLDETVIRSLRDARMPLARRRAALEAGAKDEPTPIRAVLHLLLERDRIAILPEIARAYGDLIDRREGIVKAKITTSVALESAQRDELVRRLEQASGKKIRATFALDASLIGGAKVQVGDRLIDASLRTQLDSLAKQLASS